MIFMLHLLMNPELLILRKQLGISQREMADLLAISRSKYYFLESGKRMMVEPVASAFRALRENAENPELVDSKNLKTENECIPALIQKVKTIVHNKQCELYNLKKSIEEKRSLREAATRSLNLICQEMQIFSESSHYHSRLMKMKESAIRTLNENCVESIEYVEIQIIHVTMIVEDLKAFAASKNWVIT